jgi:hypothetical protein
MPKNNISDRAAPTPEAYRAYLNDKNTNPSLENQVLSDVLAAEAKASEMSLFGLGGWYDGFIDFALETTRLQAGGGSSSEIGAVLRSPTTAVAEQRCGFSLSSGCWENVCYFAA